MSNRLKNLYKTCGPGLPNLKHSQIKASGKLSSHISDTGIGIVAQIFGENEYSFYPAGADA